MANTHTEEPAGASEQEVKAQRKKQAKREARLMLKVEQARKSQQKAEQKLGKAQSALERRKARVQKLEEKLAQTHAAREAQNGGGPAIPVPPQEPPAAPREPRETGTRTYEAALPPAEGRVDILIEDLATFAISQEGGGDLEAIIAMREESTPPAEGRADILENADSETGESIEQEGEETGPPRSTRRHSRRRRSSVADEEMPPEPESPPQSE